MGWAAWQGVSIPDMNHLALVPPSFVSTPIDAAGEKVDWVGLVWNKDRATKNITKVAFLPGAITSAGGSQMRVSLQNVDAATTANPGRGDGTQDQTVDFLASAVTASTWYKTAALSATRSVAFGEPLAVRLEFNSFAGSDAFNVQNLSCGSSGPGIGGVAHFTSSWSGQQVTPNIILEFDDGTFGTLQGAYPAATIVTTAANTGSTPDEVALKFQVPAPCKIDAIWANVGISSAGRNFELVLYEGTTALQSVSVDGDYMYSTSGRPAVGLIPETALVPGTDYYVAVKPTGTFNINIYSTTVAEANHFQAMAGGTTWHHATRTDAGAWSATTTQRPIAGIRISATSDGAGGASGVIGG